MLLRNLYHAVKLHTPLCNRWGKGKTTLTRYFVSHISPEEGRIVPLNFKAEAYGNNIAIVDKYGSHSYKTLKQRADSLTLNIMKLCKKKLGFCDLNGPRISVLVPNNSTYVVCQWAVWQCGGTFVPLSDKNPPSMWKYFLDNSESSLVICTSEYKDSLQPAAHSVGIPLYTLESNSKLDYLEAGVLTDDINKLHEMLQESKRCTNFKDKPAIIVYTSGTTGRPKGVVHTWGSVQAQIDDMLKTWEWTNQDVILHVLPLHHVHGIVNALMTPLYIGATCVMMEKFDPEIVWSALLSDDYMIEHLPRRINLFMAVPTIYAKLIEAYRKKIKNFPPEAVASFATRLKSVCQSKIRLMVSGSAPLHLTILKEWQEITGHFLLERYGMTELGMVLTNPLHGQRYPGCEEDQGELQVRGPNVFAEYVNNPEATAEAFTVDGWFKTGDTACYKDGVYYLLGRSSVDIIKSGGYKISAREIEWCLLNHEQVEEVAVVGLPDITWGQQVAAVIVPKNGSTIDLPSLKLWAKDRLPSYQIPAALKLVNELPKNAMGKLNKKDLIDNFSN